MFPVITLNYVGYSSFTYLKAPYQLTITHSLTGKIADLYDYFLIQFRLSTIRASWMIRPSLCFHIQNIIPGSSGKQMIWPYARLIIATVANIIPFWYLSIMKLIRETMGFCRSAIYSKIAISLLTPGPYPDPTRRVHMWHSWAVFVNLIPKPIFRRYSPGLSKAWYTSSSPYEFTAVDTWDFLTWHKNTPFGTGCLFVVTQLDNAKRGCIDNNTRRTFRQLLSCVTRVIIPEMGVIFN